jgi:UDP-glucuronate 4-epimerase
LSTQKRALITGGAGFIGSHLADQLLLDGWSITVVDNFDRFYSSELKYENVAGHQRNPKYRLVHADIRDADALRMSLDGNYDVIVHLAAKAGVRPSLEDPIGYQQVNVLGTQNLLQLAVEWDVKQFVFASSSSVYGVNPNVPWSESDHVLMPISPYAASKVSGELLGHVYSHLYGIRFVALRFFTAYGPRQRPDLAINKMHRLMIEGEPIPVFGDGSTRRDYTFITDLVNGIRAAIAYDESRYEVINLGGSRTVSLIEMIHTLAKVARVSPILDFQPEQPGDVRQTYADISKARCLLGYSPTTDLETGLRRFCQSVEIAKQATA